MMPPLNQQKRTNSQDPVPHWCWSPTKNFGCAGDVFWRGGCDEWSGCGGCWDCIGRWPLNGLTTAADGLGGAKILGKKNGDGPDPQNFSSLQTLWLSPPPFDTLKSLSVTSASGTGKDSIWRPVAEAMMTSSSEAVSSNDSTENPRLRRKASLFKTL